MANIKSQIKRNRQNERRRLRNRVVRGKTRTLVAKAKTAINAGTQETSLEALKVAIIALDKAAQQGVVHKNNAARRKSRLMKQMASLEE